MLRLLSWAGGSSELLAPPAARARVWGLSRLTARTHSTGFWLALWAAVAAASFAALIPVLFVVVFAAGLQRGTLAPREVLVVAVATELAMERAILDAVTI